MQYSYRQNQGWVEGQTAGQRDARARPARPHNPAWSHLATHRLPIQAKLSVGAPDDEHESEVQLNSAYRGARFRFGIEATRPYWR